jgi:hypothetical protein
LAVAGDLPLVRALPDPALALPRAIRRPARDLPGSLGGLALKVAAHRAGDLKLLGCEALQLLGDHLARHCGHRSHAR